MAQASVDNGGDALMLPGYSVLKGCADAQSLGSPIASRHGRNSRDPTGASLKSV